jgi:hypothetical protein
MAIILTGSTGVATPAVTDASGGNTATINSMTPTADSLQGFRNRIINGDMRIAQRGTGAFTTTGDYPVDRFLVANATDGAFSAQQDSSAPTGFVNSVKVTTTTADATLTTTQNIQFTHRIEGTNIADLGWGTANAKIVTLSFWVRSSLIGTFGGALRNSASDRSYPFTYNISVADTWEQKTVTIVGDTTGTWLTTTGIGINVFFGLGAGPDRSGTAGAWNSNNNVSATGAVSVIGTLNATWYITGVQLEVGSVATPFERRDYGRELIMCQRYYEKSYAVDTAVGTGLAAGIVGFNTPLTGTGDIPANISFKVTKRANPTLTVYNAVSGASGAAYRTSDAASISVTGINYVGTNGGAVFTLASGSANNYLIHWTAAIEL